jgi:lipopolysaccharide transport system ATP-binding protein
MKPIIRVEGISKEYRMGEGGQPYATLRDAIARVALAPARRWRRRPHRSVGMPAPGQPRSGDSPRPGRFWALRDVSFSLEPGDVVGIIGRNGAGKSTLLKILSRVTEPTEGRAELYGRVGSLLEVGTGFHPELTGRENVFLNAAILGMSRREVVRKLDDIVGFAGVERFIDTPVKRYSSGMVVRLGFSVAVHLEPEILIVDEVLAVGDAAFQRKCLARMRKLAGDGRTILFVSHNLAAVQNLCARAILLAGGELQADGPVEEVISRYLESVRAPLGRDAAGPIAVGADGKLELLSFGLGDASGVRLDHALCGQDVSFTLTLRAAVDLGAVTILLAVNDHFETRIAQLNSTVAGHDYALSTGTHTFRCEVPRLPLTPGDYQLDLKVLAGREHVLSALGVDRLYVESGDFFRSGRLPTDPRWAGVCQVWHTWTKVDASAASAGVRGGPSA